MNRTLPPFAPPSRPKQQLPTWKEYQATQEKWQDDYQKYVFEYLNQAVSVVNSGAQGFALTDVPNTPTVYITAYTTIISGTGTISTINTSPGFSGQIQMIAQDGFSFDTTGNISTTGTVSAGQGVLFDYSPVTQRWYPTLGAGAPSPPAAVLTIENISGDTILPAPVTAFVIVICDTTAAPITVTLPTAASTIYDIKNYTGGNNVTLQGTGGETIDGSATITIAPPSSTEVTPIQGGGAWAII